MDFYKTITSFCNSITLNVSYENKGCFNHITDATATPIRWASGRGKYSIENNNLVKHQLSDKKWKRICYRTGGVVLIIFGTITILPILTTLSAKLITTCCCNDKASKLYQQYKNTIKNDSIIKNAPFISSENLIIPKKEDPKPLYTPSHSESSSSLEGLIIPKEENPKPLYTPSPSESSSSLEDLIIPKKEDQKPLYTPSPSESLSSSSNHIQQVRPHDRSQKGEGDITDPIILRQKIASTKQKIFAKQKPISPTLKLEAEDFHSRSIDPIEGFFASDRGKKIASSQGKGEMNEGLSAGWYSTVGGRPRNEDTHLLQTMHYTANDNSQLSFDLAAVFDGHGGDAYSKYVEKEFERVFLDNLRSLDRSDTISNFWNDQDQKDLAIRNALKKSFCQLHYEGPVNGTSGTTACVNLIHDGYIYTANAGDARTVYRNENKDISPLSWDHTPEACERGVTARGAHVIMSRVNGILAVARAIGDTHIAGLTPRPSFMITEAKGGYLINACDGFWDVCTNESAFKVIDDYLEKYPNATCEDLAAHLAQRAFFVGSADNITVIVVKFNPLNMPKNANKI